MKIMDKFIVNESGATAIEYAVIVAFITLVAFGAISSTGSKVTETFNTVYNNWVGVGSEGGDSGVSASGG
jgi:pilus assembly protein Flp/PilA